MAEALPEAAERGEIGKDIEKYNVPHKKKNALYL